MKIRQCFRILSKDKIAFVGNRSVEAIQRKAKIGGRFILLQLREIGSLQLLEIVIPKQVSLQDSAWACGEERNSVILSGRTNGFDDRVEKRFP